MNAFVLAWKNILRNRRRSLVTIFITTVGCLAILVAGGFTLYTYSALEDGAARDTGHLTVSTPEFFVKDEETPLQYGLSDGPELAKRLENDIRVKRVLPRIQLSGLISNGDKSMIFMGSGTDLRGEAAVRGPFLNILEGNLGSADAGVPQVLLGNELASSLNAHPGSGLTLLATTTSGAMNAIDVEVAGVISTGWRDLDKRLVYSHLGTAQRLLNTDKISSLSVYLDETSQTPELLQELSSQDVRHSYKPWWEQAFYYFSVRALYNRIFGMLGMIIAALVFFSVANTLSMAVVERTREIGTLRALGALPQEIVAQFVREGSLIGAIGAGLGTVLALALIFGLPFLDLQMPPPPGRSVGYPLQISFSPWLTLGSFLGIVALCALAACVVSRKAAQKPIVEALGHV